MDTMLLDSLTASRARDSLPSVAGLNALATFFDELSDVTRLKIISALSVSAISRARHVAQSNHGVAQPAHSPRRARSGMRAPRQGHVLFARREEYPAYHVGGSGRGAPRQ